MKYFFDTEFIEGFHGARDRFLTSSRQRHHVDLISIGIVAEDGREYYEISSEYNYDEADDWVKENVITPLYVKTVHGDHRNHCDASNFHKYFGKTLSTIKAELLSFLRCKEEVHPAGQISKWMTTEYVELYAYFADYDWVVFCSIFGRMIDLPQGMPMFCMDLKQMMEERGLTKEWKRENFPDDNTHDALEDAKFNKRLYGEIHKHYFATMFDHLRTDPEFYYAYQSNIAMAYMDNYRWYTEKKVAEMKEGELLLLENKDLHAIANNAAKYFLDYLLLGPPNDGEQPTSKKFNHEGINPVVETEG